jgi:hypothetical protein
VSCERTCGESQGLSPGPRSHRHYKHPTRNGLVTIRGNLHARPAQTHAGKLRLVDKRVEWFSDLRDADEAVKKHYESMTPEERLDELAELIERWGHWNDGELQRVARFIELPQS